MCFFAKDKAINGRGEVVVFLDALFPGFYCMRVWYEVMHTWSSDWKRVIIIIIVIVIIVVVVVVVVDVVVVIMV